jgi:hypothetical protein
MDTFFLSVGVVGFGGDGVNEKQIFILILIFYAHTLKWLPDLRDMGVGTCKGHVSSSACTLKWFINFKII